MGVGIQRSFAVTMASGGTLTSALNLGKTFQKVYLDVPSMTSNSNIHIHAAASVSGTYRRVALPVIGTATIGHNTFTIGSATTNRVLEIPAGLQFIKIETTATCDSGQIFNVLCEDL
jgi:hypothetical protein